MASVATWLKPTSRVALAFGLSTTLAWGADISSPEHELTLNLAPPDASVCVRWPVESRTECSGDFARLDEQAGAAADRMVSSAVVRHLDWTYVLVITREPYRVGKDLSQVDARRLVIETRDEWQAAAAGAVEYTSTEPAPVANSKAFRAVIEGTLRSHDDVYVVAAGRSVYVLAFHLSDDTGHALDLDAESAEVMRSLVVKPPVAGAAETTVVDLSYWALRAAGLVVLIIVVGIFLTMKLRKTGPVNDDDDHADHR